MDAKYTKKDLQLLAAVTAYVEQYISKQVITLAMAGDSLDMSHEAIHYRHRWNTWTDSQPETSRI